MVNRCVESERIEYFSSNLSVDGCDRLSCLYARALATIQSYIYHLVVLGRHMRIYRDT